MNADEYRKLAEVEDDMWYFHALHAHVERALIDALGGSAADLLDAGCGTGGLLRRLVPRHPRWRWSAIDISELACGLARDRARALAGGSAIEIRQGSVSQLPYDDDSFDAIVSADVLYHVEDDDEAIREFRRVLRPGGVVVLNVPAYRWLWSYHDVAVEGRRRYTRRELELQLRQQGFGAIRATYWNTIPFPLVVLRRKLLPPPRSGSDVRLYPPPIEALFGGGMALERSWLDVCGRLPFGSSVFAVARKP